jgi:hypothetical protein
VASVRSGLAVGALAALILLTGCRGGAQSTSAPTTTAAVAHPVSVTASVSAKMICGKEVAEDIYEGASGVKTVAPLQPTFIDRVYSCDYVYPRGAVMRLAVKELSSPAETTAYYDSLAAKFGKIKNQPALAKAGLAQEAFSASNGSVVLRKDSKVLLVDVSKLPESFGVPADPRGDIAIDVAETIMLCWTGL